jgi:hypothetical protein
MQAVARPASHTDWQNIAEIGGTTAVSAKFPLAKFSELCLLNLTAKQKSTEFAAIA